MASLVGIIPVPANSWAQGQPAAGTPAAAIPPASATSSPASVGLAKGLSRAFADVYEKVSPGVVVIEVERGPDPDVSNQASALQFFFQNQGMVDQLPQNYRPELNQGSGFIITEDGYILTNSHVLAEGGRGEINVTLHDGRTFPAQMVGMDPASDLAVLKVDAPGLEPVELADSDKVRVGEFAFALGAPYDLRYSFTFGIIGAVGRTGLTGGQDYEEFIQTDASINPGNSGGPLVDIDGRVVGVNTLINGINRGLGFAIPINLAKQVSSQLITNGRFIRPWLGIGIQTLVPEQVDPQQFPDLESGVIVMQVLPVGPSARADLRPADVIVAVNGAAVESASDLQREILKREVGDSVELEVWRAGKLRTISVQTAERTDGLMRAANPSGPFDGAPRRFPLPLMNGETAGLEVKTLTPDLAVAMKLQAEQGVLVTDVAPGSPADIARVEAGDVITSVGPDLVRNTDELTRAIGANRGRGVSLKINRGDKKTFAILKP